MKRLALIPLTVLALLIAGCGEKTAEEEIHEVAAEYLEARADLDSELCELISEAEEARIDLIAHHSGSEEDAECKDILREQRQGEGIELTDAEQFRTLAEEAEEIEPEIEKDFAILFFEDGSYMLLEEESKGWRVDRFEAGV